MLFFLPRKRLGHSFLTSQIPPRTARSLRKSFKWLPKLREMDRIHFLERSTKLQEAPRSQTPWSMPSESLISTKPKLLGRAFKTWLPEHVTVLRKRHVLEFLVFLRDNKNYLRLTDIPFLYPSRRLFDINFADRNFSLLAKPQFHLSPPVPKKVPKWSLDHALEIFPNTKVSEQLSVPVIPFS